VTQPIKVAVTGASGNIGYALLFRIASGQLFGPDVPVDLHLFDITPSLPALRGVVMELEDCAFPLLRNIVVSDELSVVMKEANWVILVGAVPRKKGMERSDLLKINGGIFTGQGKAINDYAAKDVRVLVVGNPCNTNCLIAMNSAPDVPRDRFYAMTRLDENRSKAQLAIKAKVAVSDVTQMAVWGNHSSTQYPDFYNARIKGELAPLVIQDDQWLTTSFISTVQQRGAAIIEARGLSSAASAANAIIDSVSSILFETKKDDYYSVCRCSFGEYEIDEGLIFSFPSQTRQGKSEVVLGIEQNEFGKNKLKLTLEELKEERDAVKALGLLKN